MSWLAVQLEHEGIEADLGRRTQESLARKGLQWAVPIFAGRDGALTGKAADDNEPTRALAAIRETWGVRVTENRAELLEHIERYLWSARWRDGRLVLGGYRAERGCAQGYHWARGVGISKGRKSRTR